MKQTTTPAFILKNIFECWNSETRVLAAIIDAPDLAVAIKRIKNDLASYDNTKATPDNVFVCSAVPENMTFAKIASARRFGVWMA